VVLVETDPLDGLTHSMVEYVIFSIKRSLLLISFPNSDTIIRFTYIKFGIELSLS
jgi:hypothetical protein